MPSTPESRAPVSPGAPERLRQRVDGLPLHGQGATISTPEPMRSSPGGLFGSLTRLIRSFLDLAICEAKQAGVALAFMLAFGLAAVILTTAGLGLLVACIVMALVESDLLSSPTALVIGAVLCFAASGGFALLLVRRVKDLSFEATRRQMGGT